MEQRDAGRQMGEAKMQQQQPTAVPHEAKQVGQTLDRWSWVEPAVWTERMLTALEKGVKGGKWFSLMDKVYAMPNLQRAFERVKANGGAAGVDNQTIEMFESHSTQNLEKIARALREGNYQPKAIKRVWIPKPGTSQKRPLGIPIDISHCTSLQSALGLSYFIAEADLSLQRIHLC
jgi:RNA-directed DNA polymerase